MHARAATWVVNGGTISERHARRAIIADDGGRSL